MAKISVWLLLSLLILSPVTMPGQQANDAVVVGTVLDATQAVVSGATITLTHLETNTTTEVLTDARGRYRTPPLRIGRYQVSVQAPGFKQFIQQGVTLNIGDVRQVDAQLQLGAISESVTVNDAPPLLQTETSSAGTVLTNKQIVDLPLNGRDYLQLAALSPGTIPSTGREGVSIGGQAGLQVAFLLDGEDNNNQQLNTDHSGQKEIIKPSIDAIEEFRVVTNGNSAEFGRSSSGVVSVALKSGSNELHGSAFEFYRNASLDARNYFSDPTQPKPPFGRNQYGATIGGPVVRNRTFFFGDFEFARIRQSQTLTSVLPDANQKAGQFTDEIVDPITGKAFPTQTINGKSLYVIPQDRLDHIAVKAQAYYPAPTVAGTGFNYVYSGPLNEDDHRWDVRIDQVLGAKDNAYFRFSNQTRDAAVISTLPPDSAGNYYAGGQDAPGEVGAETTDSLSFILAENRVWSSVLLSSVHVGWNFLRWNNVFPNQKLKGIGIQGVNESQPGFSDLQISGYRELGINNVPNLDVSQNREVSGDVTWTRRAHTLKFGVQANWLQSSFHSSQSASGVFSFDGRYTGDPYADFLLGYASEEALTNYVNVEQRTPLTHFFVQDDWRASKRLTLNLGLRYELNPPAVDNKYGGANFDLDSTPGVPKLVFAQKGGDRAARSLIGVNNLQFAPRVGFSYELPDNRTTVRGGYGIYYSYQVPLRPENNPPNHLIIDLTTDPNAPPKYILGDGFSSNALSLENTQFVTLTSLDRRSTVPRTQQWNFNLQHEFPGKILVEAGYYANKLDHGWRSFDANPAPPGPGDVDPRRLYTTSAIPGTPYTITLASISRQQLDGYSDFNALQLKAEKRYSQGLTFLAGYAYSKVIAFGDSSGVQNYYNQAAERAVSVQDLKHHFVGSAVYELPFGKGKPYGENWNRVTNGVLGGWSISPIVTANTGFPINLSVRGNPSNTGGKDRPNVVGRWNLAHPSISEWFDTTAFAKNPKYTFGNAGRNILRGPGLIDLDLALHKSVQISERVSVQLRMESFNATNTPPLGDPNTQVGNANLGKISSAGTPRDNQLAVKLLF
jgi:Carboxypeptidase regulatory-like domain